MSPTRGCDNGQLTVCHQDANNKTTPQHTTSPPSDEALTLFASIVAKLITNGSIQVDDRDHPLSEVTQFNILITLQSLLSSYSLIPSVAVVLSFPLRIYTSCQSLLSPLHLPPPQAPHLSVSNTSADKPEKSSTVSLSTQQRSLVDVNKHAQHHIHSIQDNDGVTLWWVSTTITIHRQTKRLSKVTSSISSTETNNGARCCFHHSCRCLLPGHTK